MRPVPAGTDADLLSAVFDAFAANGYEGTSVREIARDLGVSHNTLPQRFGSKERLWRAAVDEVVGAAARDLLEDFWRAPEDPLDRLRHMMRAFVIKAAERPQVLRLVSAETSVPGPRLTHLQRHFIDPVATVAGGLLRELREQGRVRTDDVALVYFLMVHAAASPMLHGEVHRLLGSTVELDDADAVASWADRVIDVILHGITAG